MVTVLHARLTARLGGHMSLG